MNLAEWQHVLEYMSGYRVFHNNEYMLVEDVLKEGVTIPDITSFNWGFKPDESDRSFVEGKVPFGRGIAIRTTINDVTFIILLNHEEIMFAAFRINEAEGLNASEAAFKIRSLEPVKAFDGVTIMKALGRIAAIAVEYMNHFNLDMLKFSSATDYVDQLYSKMANNKHLQSQIDALGFEFSKLINHKYIIVRKK